MDKYDLIFIIYNKKGKILNGSPVRNIFTNEQEKKSKNNGFLHDNYPFTLFVPRFTL